MTQSVSACGSGVTQSVSACGSGGDPVVMSTCGGGVTQSHWLSELETCT